MNPRSWIACTALASAMTIAACGGGSGSGTPMAPSPTPTPSPDPSPTPAPSQATITITSAGVSPNAVTVAVGGRVTFVNNDSISHDMNSDPHPDHTDCPAVNVGSLQPGQSRQTAVLSTARTCGFHDHNQPDVASLRGTITIQ